MQNKAFRRHISSDEFRWRVIKVEDLTDEEIALIAKAEVPVEYAYLDEELKEWQP